jgi:hypothetical protein
MAAAAAAAAAAAGGEGELRRAREELDTLQVGSLML